MDLNEMLTRIEVAVDDDRFTVAGNFIPLINEALSELAEQYPINALATSDTITVDAAGASPVSLPDDYLHDVYRVENTTNGGNVVKIRENLNALKSLFDGCTYTGYITNVAIAGDLLHFEPNPTTDVEDQTLTLYYYKQFIPVTVPVDGEEPQTIAWVPDRFQEGLIVDYVLMEIFKLIEDGFDGQKINTAFYQSRYDAAREKFDAYTLTNPRQKPVIKRNAQFM